MTEPGALGRSLGISGTSKLGTGASSVLCAWGRKAVLAGGVFYSCLLSGGKKKTITLSPANTSVSWRQMCFHLVVGWEETTLIKFPGLVPVHRMFLLMALCVYVCE